MQKSGLIITADDYGINESCNRGIREAVELGIVTSVHVLMNFVSDREMQKLIDSVKKSGNKCGIGLHLNSTDGKALVQVKSAFTRRKNKVFKFVPLVRYDHLKITKIRENGDAMETELKAQYDKLVKYLGSADKIDAISSHYNIHMWDDFFLEMINKITKGTDIPFRSPLRWSRDPNTENYPLGTKPLIKAGLRKGVRILDSPATVAVMATSLLYKKQIRMKQILTSSEKKTPMSNSGHWFGQPTTLAATWFIASLDSLNTVNNHNGYSSELYMHIADSNRGKGRGLEYNMKKRYKEYNVLMKKSFQKDFAAFKEVYGTNHGSYRTVLGLNHQGL